MQEDNTDHEIVHALNGRVPAGWYQKEITHGGQLLRKEKSNPVEEALGDSNAEHARSHLRRRHNSRTVNKGRTVVYKDGDDDSSPIESSDNEYDVTKPLQEFGKKNKERGELLNATSKLKDLKGKNLSSRSFTPKTLHDFISDVRVPVTENIDIPPGTSNSKTTFQTIRVTGQPQEQGKNIQISFYYIKYN